VILSFKKPFGKQAFCVKQTLSGNNELLPGSPGGVATLGVSLRTEKLEAVQT